MPPPAPPGARLERSPRLAPPLPVRLGRRILRHRVAVEAAVALVLLGALTAGFWPTAQPARSAAGRWAARAAPYVARLAADTASQPGRLAADVTRARRDVPPAPVNRWEATWQFALSQLAAGNRAGGGAALVALTQMTEQATSPRP